MSEIVISGCIKEVSSLLEENYFTVMSIIAALYIGLLAFMYPKIIEIRQNLQNISSFLYEEFSKNCFIKYYIEVISCSLIFCILSIIFNYLIVFIYLNIIISIFIVIYNWYAIKVLENFSFNKFKLCTDVINEIDLKNIQDLYDKFNILQSYTIKLINNDILDFELIRKSINCFTQFSYNYIKQIYNKTWKSNDKYNQYYQYPIERILYINQQAIEKNQIDIFYIIQDELLRLCDDIDSLVEPSIFSPIPYEGYHYLFQCIQYPLQQQKINSIIINDVIKIYIKLIKKSKNGLSIYEELRPNNYLFRYIKEIINIDTSYMKQIRQNLEDILSPNSAEFYFDGDKKLYENAFYYIVNITFDILGYYYYKNNYVAIRDYISDKFKYIISMFPNNIKKIIMCVFKNDTSIFNSIFELKFNEYTQDKEYKYYILFLYLCLIKQQVDIYRQHIDLIKKKKCSKKEKDNNIKFAQNYIDTFLNKNYNSDALIKISNNYYYNSYIDNFFNNTELLTLFKINTNDIEKYKNFVITQIKKIENIGIKQKIQKKIIFYLRIIDFISYYHQ